MVDGITGRMIWSFNTTKSEMSSDLVMRTAESQLDFFVFRANGRLVSPDSSTAQRVIAAFLLDVLWNGANCQQNLFCCISLRQSVLCVSAAKVFSVASAF